jgi:peptide/nickel transport system ATP-binding protein
VPQADPELQAARRAAMAEPEQARPAGPGPGTGCPFAARCSYVIPDCLMARPPLARAPGGTDVACIRAADIPALSRNEVST